MNEGTRSFAVGWELAGSSVLEALDDSLPHVSRVQESKYDLKYRLARTIVANDEC